MKYFSNCADVDPYQSQNGGGYASIVPSSDYRMDDCIAWLEKYPYDYMMLKHLMRAGQYSKSNFDSILSIPAWPLILKHDGRYSNILKSYKEFEKIFLDNITFHKELPELDLSGLSETDPRLKIYLSNNPEDYINTYSNEYSIVDLTKSHNNNQEFIFKTGIRDIPILATKQNLLSLLEARGFFHSYFQKPHGIKAFGFSLTSIKWSVNVSGEIGGIPYNLNITQQSSGKSIEFDASMNSLYMESMERISTCFGAFGLDDYSFPIRFIKGSYNELRKSYYEEELLNLEKMNTIINCNDYDIHWMRSKRLTESGLANAMVPVQLVFQYVNPNEPLLFNWTSNGLASGNTMDEAKYQSLLELIERDGLFQNFYSKSRSYILKSNFPEINEILAEYRKKGLLVKILDLTTDFGVPVYQAYVDVNGKALKGHGAHLNGKIAIIRALGELASQVYGEKLNDSNDILNSENLNLLAFEDVPDYSTGIVKDDLNILEALFLKNKYDVYYCDLTVKQFGIPVVRTIVPSLDMPQLGLSKRRLLNYYKTKSENKNTKNN